MSKIELLIEEKQQKENEAIDFAYWEHLRDLDSAMIDYDNSHSRCCDALIENSRCRDCKENI